jgi:hypothetical protein
MVCVRDGRHEPTNADAEMHRIVQVNQSQPQEGTQERSDNFFDFFKGLAEETAACKSPTQGVESLLGTNDLPKTAYSPSEIDEGLPDCNTFE